MGRHDFGKGEDLVDVRLELAGSEVVEHILLGGHERFGVRNDLKEGVAADGEALGEGGEEGIGRGFLGEGAVLVDDAAPG